MSSKYFTEMAKAIVQINDEKLAKDFLRSILTPSELEEVCKRLQIVKMLDKGVPQRKIAQDLSVSMGTVSRGSREMKYGNQAFQKVLGLIA